MSDHMMYNNCPNQVLAELSLLPEGGSHVHKHRLQDGVAVSRQPEFLGAVLLLVQKQGRVSFNDCGYFCVRHSADEGRGPSLVSWHGIYLAK